MWLIELPLARDQLTSSKTDTSGSMSQIFAIELNYLNFHA
jgi:hypothetical protein